MTQEEKAKLYDELKVKAQELTEDGYIDKLALVDMFPELKESEDEQHCKWILEYLYDGLRKSDEQFKDHFKAAIAWLEKQGEYAKFRNKIQIGDKVTRNKDGVLVNLSQLNRVAKKQGEQNHAWSEEDERMYKAISIALTLKSAEGYLRSWYITPEEADNWLKSIKDRVQPQTTWKPSDEQMNELNYVVNLMASSERPTENDLYYNILKSLRQQLKKLMEDKLKDK